MATNPTKWVKGKSGNPKGKAKRFPEVRASLEAGLQSGADHLRGICDGSIAVEPKERIAAIGLLFSYAMPKPVAAASTAVLERFAALCAALAGPDDEADARDGGADDDAP